MSRPNYRNGDLITLKGHNCDSCQVAMITNKISHEVGCPDAWRDYAVECWQCGADFYRSERNQSACDSCITSQSEYEDLDDE